MALVSSSFSVIGLESVDPPSVVKTSITVYGPEFRYTNRDAFRTVFISGTNSEANEQHGYPIAPGEAFVMPIDGATTLHFAVEGYSAAPGRVLYYNS